METRLSEKPTPDFWNRTVSVTLTFVSSPRVLVGGCDEKKIRDYVVWLVQRVFCLRTVPPVEGLLEQQSKSLAGQIGLS